MSEIHLELLGTRALLRSDNDEMRRVLQELWLPFITEPGESSLTLDVTSVAGEWTLVVGEDEFAYINPWRAVDHVRHALLEGCLGDVGPLIILHGAVLEKDGKALILAGPSGAGKTTLSLKLLEDGWLYVSDDVAPYDPATGEVISFRKPVNLKDLKSWRKYTSHWSPPAWEAEPMGGLPVPASSLPVTQLSRVSPESLVFCAFSPDRPNELLDLSIAQALAQGGELIRRMDRENLGHLRTLAENVSRGSLTYQEADQAIRSLQTWLFRSEA